MVEFPLKFPYLHILLCNVFVTVVILNRGCMSGTLVLKVLVALQEPHPLVLATRHRVATILSLLDANSLKQRLSKFFDTVILSDCPTLLLYH